jgi:TetR/AcrR family transcriptional regulator
MSSYEDLRLIALGEFALAGYTATPLQRIADLAGLSKSSVLYHFASKEALLEAAIVPAVERMDAIISPLEGVELTAETKQQFIVQFVDFLLEFRGEVHIFISQGKSLEDVPVMERANQMVLRMAAFFTSAVDSLEDQMRFSVALAGAAYSLDRSQAYAITQHPQNETRAALITIISELLAPVAARPLVF